MKIYTVFHRTLQSKIFVGNYLSIVCECGAKKLGHADFTSMHSSWCPVYKKF
jgi:hypothetical protein